MERFVNDWELADNDTLLYWKEVDEGIMLIDMTWMDQTREDPEYGTGKEWVVCTSTEESHDLDEAMNLFADLHHTDAYAISDIVSREEAEGIIQEYIESH